MDKIMMVVTDYGEFPAPSDLIELYEKAPKDFVSRISEEDGTAYLIKVPDASTEAGKAFYRREAELIAEFDKECTNV